MRAAHARVRWDVLKFERHTLLWGTAMAELVVACFDTQFEANSAAEKLISRGVQREQIVLTFNESIGHSPSSSTAPTTVISRVSHRGNVETTSGKKKARQPFSDRPPSRIPDPSLIGHTTLVVELRGEMTMDDVCMLLENAGASRVHRTREHDRVREDPAMWPSLGQASPEDIERSIRASQRGAALKTRRRR